MLDHEDTTIEVEGFNLDSFDLLRFAAGNVLARNTIAGSSIQVALYRLIPQQPVSTE
jgi:hypothetical protein